jgi:hypothetical protein
LTTFGNEFKGNLAATNFAHFWWHITPANVHGIDNMKQNN